VQGNWKRPEKGRAREEMGRWEREKRREKDRRGR